MTASESQPAPTLKAWLAGPMEAPAGTVIERVLNLEDVVHVAVMPDVHLATDVCVGTVMATRRLVYPAAVGGDIGCGMLAIAFDAQAHAVRNPVHAGAILRAMGERIPTQRRNRARLAAMPDLLATSSLSHPSLCAALQSHGRLQLGTLGGGNHFVELQADEEDRLWLMIHSGSRNIGQVIKAFHMAGATIGSGSMRALDTHTDAGQAYLHDQEWARRFADANRLAMAAEVIEILGELLNIRAVESAAISCDHNHVAAEQHLGQLLLIHRKGTMPADAGLPGVVPGSMGTQSFHVEGKGCEASLRSSAHGAGRLLSRHAARERFARSDLRGQMEGVWFDTRLADAMREESPRAYKDIRAVMRAQGELVKITRTLRPVLVYKGK